MGFLKKQRASFFILAFAAVIALAGLIVFAISSGVESYEMTGSGAVIFAQVVILILLVAGTYFGSKFGNKAWVSALLFIALVLSCLSFAFALVNRVSLAASLFTYDWSNTIGWKAFTTGMASMVIFLVVAILITVAGFMKLGKKED